MKLIERNVDLNLVDSFGFTPIHVAIKKGCLAAIEFAIHYNSRVQKPVFDFNMKGRKGWTPLQYCVIKSS